MVWGKLPQIWGEEGGREGEEKSSPLELAVFGTFLQPSSGGGVAVGRADVQRVLGDTSEGQIFDGFNLNYYHLLLIKCG